MTYEPTDAEWDAWLARVKETPDGAAVFHVTGAESESEVADWLSLHPGADVRIREVSLEHAVSKSAGAA